MNSYAMREFDQFHPTIDEILGPGNLRYFAEGFKKVRRTLGFREFVPSTRSLAAYAKLEYPASWSQKNDGRELLPHLSTLDAMYLGTHLTETMLHAYFDIGVAKTPAAIRRLELRAGAAPDEQLQNVPIGLVLGESKKDPHGFHPYSTQVSANIGAMSVRIEIEHGGSPRADPIFYSGPDQIAHSPLTEECLRSLSPCRRHHLQQVRLNEQMRHVQADFEIGCEGAAPSFITPIEVVAALAQLAQVLIYRVDKIDRSSSDTLWMRQLLFESIGPDTPYGRRVADVVIDSDKSVRLGGRPWRLYRVLGQMGTGRVMCLLTHRVPEAQSGTAASTAAFSSSATR